MIYHILLTCTVALVSGQRYPKSIQIQPRAGYASSVVHSYSGNNDLQAKSSINVDFQPQRSRYVTSGGSFNKPIISMDSKKPGLFNVGYDLTFDDNNFNMKKTEPKYTNVNNKKFENAEVITGKIKQNEKVRAPSSNFSPQDFVISAFMKQKQLNSASTRYTSTPIKTKSKTNVFPSREHISKLPSQSPKLSYDIQQNIFKDVIKATKPEPIQLNPEFKASYDVSENHWGNQQKQKSRRLKHTNLPVQLPTNFNHETALKNSETFDFSNAHGEITFGDNKSPDSFPAASQQYTNYQVKEEPDKIISDVQQSSDFNNINVEAYIPKNLRGVKPLPLDTSLIKDPVLTTSNFKGSPKHGRVIPIHFDVRQIQTTMQQELNKVQGQSQGYFSNKRPSSADHDVTGSKSQFSTYGKPEAVVNSQYGVGYNYGYEQANYEDDAYKIVSMRPPPISHKIRY